MGQAVLNLMDWRAGSGHPAAFLVLGLACMVRGE